ncbi:MAG: DUF3179 domain-containing protein [Thaumarchaeota archaeon]|nr:DUF3179 domain-containing protein [Nitrososphaerota archaeon]
MATIAAISISIILIYANTSHPLDNKRTEIASEDTILITNGIKHIVPLEKIVGGGPPKDGIPSIDHPKFVQASKAQFLKDDDLVIGLNINGEKKAYPLFILVWHEIVNDKIGDTPVTVTYCPLCFTTQVFDRTINGTEVEFGTSGKLYNSNLVMYDRYTGSYWSQALGRSITGELAGFELKKITFDVARWKDWKSLYPESLVLTTDTGFQRAYGSDPYGDYYTNPQIIFPVTNKDDRLGPKEIILGLEYSNSYKAYKLADLESSKLINDKINDKKILLASLYPKMARAFDREVDGKSLEFTFSDDKIIDKQTNSEWSFEGQAVAGPLKGRQLDRLTLNPGFWFEWVAFHPSTEIYQG